MNGLWASSESLRRSEWEDFQLMLHLNFAILVGAGLVSFSMSIVPIALNPQTGLPEIKAAQAQGQGGGQGSGGGNSGQGVGNGSQAGSSGDSSGGSGGASGDSKAKGSANSTQSGYAYNSGATASSLGSLNAAHASEKALANVSRNSTVGLIANYKDAITAITELEAEINSLMRPSPNLRDWPRPIQQSSRPPSTR
jgi:hypothetical protein